MRRIRQFYSIFPIRDALRPELTWSHYRSLIRVQDIKAREYYIKCFVLIDLKTNKITHQDVGQMDMYVRMFDELQKNKTDNPTLGIILCSETDADIARYSILKENEQLFASKYKLYLPSEKELGMEIEREKMKLQEKLNKLKAID